MQPGPPGYPTNPTIFLRLKAPDAAPREIAWHEFEARYAPIISNFARHLGAPVHDLDDIVQDILLGFFLTSPTFVYDPAKGKFRSYLMICTYRAVARRFGRNAKFRGRSLDQVDPTDIAVHQTWDDVWERQKLSRAIDELRGRIGQSKTFQAFEMYAVFDEPASSVAGKLDMHVNNVYRAKEQVTRMLQEKMRAMCDEE